MDESPVLSLVVPVYNEEQALERFHVDQLLPECSRLGLPFEILYINDGSSDNSLEILQRLGRENEEVRVVSLSRNFGKESAVSAGLHYARGQCCIILDADGQHPPRLIPEFIRKWREGAQVVIGLRRTNSKEGWLKKWGSRVFFRISRILQADTDVYGSTDFRLVDREVRDAFSKFQEGRRVTRGLIDWLGYERDYVPFDAPERLAGKAAYSAKKLVNLAADGLVSHTVRPLGWLLPLGLTTALGALVLLAAVALETLVLHDPMRLHPSGTAWLAMCMLFLVGVIISSQGIVAVYLSYVHSQAQGRPLYNVNNRDSVGI